MTDQETLAVLVGDSWRRSRPYSPTERRYDAVELVDLTRGALTADEILPDLTAEITVHHADEEFQNTSEEIRNTYIDTVSELTEFDEAGRLTTPIHDTIPLWWILVDQFKSKSTGFDHSFNVICRALVTLEILSTVEPDEVVILSENRRERRLYGSMLDERGHEVETRPRMRRTFLSGLLVYSFLLGLLRMGVEVTKTLVSWPLERALRPEGGASKPDVLLFSRTKQWIQHDWTRDRYYHHFPEMLAEAEDLPYLFALHLSDDEIALAPGRIVEGSPSGRASLLHARLGPVDHLTVLRSYLVATVRLVGFLRTSEANWQISGLNVRSLLASDLLSGLHTVPHALVQYECLKQELQRRDPAVVTTTHFESKIGRMATAAARRESVAILGIQHGPITCGKLQYSIGTGDQDCYPLPDVIAVDGPFAAEVLDRGDFPSDRIEITGGPRYDDLFTDAETRESDDGGEGPLVVFFGLSDFRSMASVVLPVLEDVDREVLLKPHPSVREKTETYLESQLEGGDESLRIVDENAHDLIRRARIVVSSYSSTAIETLALGTPLICVTPRNRLDPTPFDGDVVPTVCTTSEFREELRSQPDVEGEEIARFLDRFFGPQDGHAAERMAGLCREVSDESRPG